MHPLHDIEIDPNTIEESLRVVIEIPQGSKNKYELDKDAGLLRLDRVLYSAVHYPANYGSSLARTATTATPSTFSPWGRNPFRR